MVEAKYLARCAFDTLGPDVLADIYPDLALLGYYLEKGVKVLVFQCSALQNELL